MCLSCKKCQFHAPIIKVPTHPLTWSPTSYVRIIGMVTDNKSYKRWVDQQGMWKWEFAPFGLWNSSVVCLFTTIPGPITIIPRKLQHKLLTEFCVRNPKDGPSISRFGDWKMEAANEWEIHRVTSTQVGSQEQFSLLLGSPKAVQQFNYPVGPVFPISFVLLPSCFHVGDQMIVSIVEGLWVRPILVCSYSYSWGGGVALSPTQWLSIQTLYLYKCAMLWKCGMKTRNYGLLVIDRMDTGRMCSLEGAVQPRSSNALQALDRWKQCVYPNSDICHLPKQTPCTTERLPSQLQHHLLLN